MFQVMLQIVSPENAPVHTAFEAHFVGLGFGVLCLNTWHMGLRCPLKLSH